MQKKTFLAAGTLIIVVLAVALVKYRDTKTIFPVPAFNPTDIGYVVEGEPAEIFGEPAMGDMDGDGREDAALLLKQDSEGSGVFYYATVALNTENGALTTNALFIGDRIAPQTFGVHDGVFTVNYADRKPGEPMTATPNVGMSRYFVVDGGVLRERE